MELKGKINNNIDSIFQVKWCLFFVSISAYKKELKRLSFFFHDTYRDILNDYLHKRLDMSIRSL